MPMTPKDHTLHKIPERILEIASLASEAASFWDVGCDHGYLGLYLLKRNPQAFVHFVDKSPKVCSTLVAKIESLPQLSSEDRQRIKVWARDARQIPSSEFSGDVFICGMGGDLIIKLIEHIQSGFGSKRFILSPDTQRDKLKNFLLASGLTFSEQPLEDGAKFALVVEAAKILEVRPSSIHGLGLFAKAFIPKGTVLPWSNSKEIGAAEFDQLSTEEKGYTDIQNGKRYLVGIPERFINHSCESNTSPGNLCDITIRDLHIGEEITADYKNFFILDGSFSCACGSANCRGTIFGRKP